MKLRIPERCPKSDLPIAHTFYNSVDDLVSDARERNEAGYNSSKGTSWTGGASYKQCEKWARTGWVDGLARARDLASMIDVGALGGHGYQYSINRGRFSKSRTVAYLRGDRGPRIRRRKVRTDSPRPIKIIAHGSFLGECPAEYAARRGAAVVALVVTLQDLGYPVDLTILRWGHRSGKDVCADEVRVSEAGSGLDPDRVAFALGHPSMFRFFFLNAHSWTGTRSIPAEIMEQADIGVQQPDSGNPELQSDAAAMRWVVEQVRESTGLDIGVRAA